jgi:hypothetical protein
MVHEAVILVPGAGLDGYVEQTMTGSYRARCRCGFEVRKLDAQTTAEALSLHIYGEMGWDADGRKAAEVQ